jgi:hypothetical protein
MKYALTSLAVIFGACLAAGVCGALADTPAETISGLIRAAFAPFR